MRHTIDLLLGPALGQVSSNLKQYVSKYNEENLDSFFQVMTWNNGGVSKIENVPIDKDVFCSDLNELYKVASSEPESIDSDEKIKAYFSGDLFRNTLNVKSQDDDDTIGINVIFLLYDTESVKTAINIVKQIEATRKRYQIDFIGIYHDLAYLFNDETKDPAQLEKATFDSINCINAISDSCFHRFLLLQDCNSRGVSLNFDNNTFLKILGEYSMICIENYHSIYPQSEEYEKKEITAIGLSQLFFDKFYFVQFLLSSAYLKIFDNEQISFTDVNANKVSKIAQEKLNGHTKILEDFFDGEIMPLMRNNESDVDIMTSITPKFNTMIDKLSSELQSFIEDETLSLPEKKAILAQIIGQDDELVTGYTINRDLLTLDDWETQSLDTFINANNDLVKTETDKDGKTTIEPAILESDDEKTGKTNLHVDEIKKLREDSLRSTTYIRQKSKDLEALSSQIDNAVASNKLLTENGFVFGNNTYKPITNIEEVPLKETYKPRDDAKCPESVDLRSAFTNIKDQGTIGACTVFAISSIYEFILKKSKSNDPDLSERFVYYNVRKDKGSLDDSGSNYLEVINSITENGICEENFCKYENDNIDTPPSDIAIQNAKTHKIQTAKNVCIKHTDFLSALSEGYPIAISLKLFDSFGDCNGGFIQRPSDEEIKNGQCQSHAMVICGYSEKNKVYIVRNSWGNEFGDKGYCYIPFNYIEDENLNKYACIITSINNGEETKGFDKQTTVSFNETDANIKYALLKIAIEDEKHKVVNMQDSYSKYRKWYEKIVTSLGNPSVRDNIFNQRFQKYGEEIDEAQKKYDDFTRESSNNNNIEPNRQKQIDDFNDKKRADIIIQIGIMLVFVITWVVGFYVSSKWLSYKFSWIDLIVIGLCVLFLILYLGYKRHQYHHLLDYLDDESEKKLKAVSVLKDEQKRLKLKMQLSGMLIDKFSSLHAIMVNKYQLMKSYVDNLNTWYGEEKKKLYAMEPISKNDAFIPLITNEALEQYFNEHKDDITKDIHLYELFKDYEISESSIKQFKDKIKNIMINKLLAKLSDFSIYKHISGEEQYPYLNREYANIKDLLELLNPRSEIFLQPHLSTISDDQRPSQFIFIHTDTQEEKFNWSKEYRKHFSLPPVPCETVSHFRLIVLQRAYFKCVDVLPKNK
jgi:C1A family cysteine protease